MTRNLTEPITLTPEQRVEITRLFHSMPYGGGINFKFPEGGMTGESIVENLTRLRDTLRRISESNRQSDDELRKLRADVAAVRRVFGAPACGLETCEELSVPAGYLRELASEHLKNKD